MVKIGTNYQSRAVNLINRLELHGLWSCMVYGFCIEMYESTYQVLYNADKYILICNSV